MKIPGMDRRTFYGAVGSFAILWGLTCMYMAAQVPEKSQGPRLACIVLGLMCGGTAGVGAGVGCKVIQL